MGLFSRKNKTSGEDTNSKSKASTDEKSMNRSAGASGKQTRGRTNITSPRTQTSISAPSSPGRYFSHASNTSTQGYYTTDSEAPPIPQPPHFNYENITVPPRNPRRNSDNYASRAIPTPHPNNGTTKLQKPSHLSQSPPHYADSGYGSNNGSYSALHSRAPSEVNPNEALKHIILRNEGDFLPELKLGEDNLSKSLIGAVPKNVQTTNDSYFIRQAPEADNDRAVSPIDADADFRLPKSTKSSLQTTKRTRFLDAPEEPTLEQLQHFHCAPVTGSRSNFASPESDASADTSSFISVCDALSAKERSQEAESQMKYMFMETSYPKSSEQGRRSSSVRRLASTLPPLSILEGFKVNKKGKILDEEGDPIGELVEGDLLDCVRQKANAQGEVIDDYGRVVGIVRTIHTGPELPTQTGTTLPPKDSQSNPPVQQVRSTSNKAGRLHSATSPRAVGQGAGIAQQAQINVPSPIAESPRVGRPGSAHRQYESPVPVVHSDNLEEPTEAHPPSQVVSQSPEELPKQATLEPEEVAIAEQSRRPGLSQSERSLSELSKPWARPNMTSVPEDDVPEDANLPDSPGLYAFKGEVPADDRPQREARSRSPHVAINAKAALALGQPNSAMFGSTGNNRLAPRRATTQLAGSYANGSLSIVPSNKPYRPSPLSSQETSPKRSDASDTISEDGRPYYPNAPSVAASIYSVATTTSKPRTYFTHGGKITVDANDELKSAKAAEKVPEVLPVVQEKKKSRLSMGFGRKTAAK